jgi:hypothetical protein
LTVSFEIEACQFALIKVERCRTQQCTLVPFKACGAIGKQVWQPTTGTALVVHDGLGACY